MATNLSGNTLTLGSYALTGWKSGVIMVPNCSYKSQSSKNVTLSVGESASISFSFGSSTGSTATVTTTGSCIYFNDDRGFTFYGSSFNMYWDNKRHLFFRVS